MLDLTALCRWFHQNKRDLPWRNSSDPYAVWISEVMLQQTQVAVVIPYFLRWMELYPTVEALAKAPIEQVIKTWEGLGYYSRARNLHAGAQYVLAKHAGILPNTREELLAIKGLGDYTVGAILSFAFKQKAPAVDGNVGRVITRFFNISEDIGKSTTKKKLRQLVEKLLPETEPWNVSEGLIELGATICTKRPKCSHCPLKKGCEAFRLGNTQLLPFKNKKTKIEKILRTVLLIKVSKNFLVRQVPKGEIMEGLYEFPYFEGGKMESELAEQISVQYGLQVVFKQEMDQVEHSFTRFQATLTPLIFETQEIKSIQGFEWIAEEKLGELPFSSGHRKIFHALDSILINN